jgi:FMN phosphatase YigB (HAD superfamily)
MPVPVIRAIIFDIGRVLVRLDLARAGKSLASGLSLTPEEMWLAIEKDPRWPDWQEGRLSPHDWHLNLAHRFGLDVDFETFKNTWNLALAPEPIHPVGFFKSLSKHYRLGLLSNTDPVHVARLESSYDFFAYFKPSRRTYSCVVGASKPNPLIYREALRACRVRAEEAVYIDDIPAYVEAARRLGMAGIAYETPGQLRRDLGDLGIATDG